MFGTICVCFLFQMCLNLSTTSSAIKDGVTKTVFFYVVLDCRARVAYRRVNFAGLAFGQFRQINMTSKKKDI